MHDLSDPQAEALIVNLLAQPETAPFESRRVSGKGVGKALARGRFVLALSSAAGIPHVADDRPRNASLAESGITVEARP